MAAYDPEQTLGVRIITPVYMPHHVIDCLKMLLARLASDAVLDAAYEWLCHRRKAYPPNADVWSFRRQWVVEKKRIHANLLAGEYRFSLLDRATLANGSDIDLWSARDALVLKALTMVLSDVLPVSPRCTHIKGHGGAKAAVRQVMARLGDNSFVIRTDVKSYYASIGHVLLRSIAGFMMKEPSLVVLQGTFVVINLIGIYRWLIA